jgi:hypothetical protein
MEMNKSTAPKTGSPVLPQPGTAEWQRQRDRLLTLGSIKATGIWRTLKLDIWADRPLQKEMRRVTAHFKVSLAVVARMVVAARMAACTDRWLATMKSAPLCRR